jgi:hypothetical protein
MKSAVIIFHRDIDRYFWEWIEKCYQSILQQSYKDFDVFELDYGGDDRKTFPNSNFYSIEMPTHAHAHNFLLDEVFKLGYDCAFNVNVDDWYALNRFEKQIPYIELGYDVVSSNFYRVNEDESMKQSFYFDQKDIQKEAKKEHNVIAHPVLCYSRNFWQNCDKLDPKDIPFDDFVLWKKSYKKDFKFIILPDFLLFQRIHRNNISKKQ